MQIRPAEPRDAPAREEFLSRWFSSRVARKGEIGKPLDHPSLLADRDGELVGVLTYVISGDECEVLTLHVEDRRGGIGTALISEVTKIARDAGCTRLWLITTNDNVDALRFYQRRGFRLAALYPGAVDESRQSLKPEIPLEGDYGIPLRDEIELEQDLTNAG